jgi:hypothetical protein
VHDDFCIAMLGGDFVDTAGSVGGIGEDAYRLFGICIRRCIDSSVAGRILDNWL